MLRRLECEVLPKESYINLPLYKSTYLYLPFGHGPWPINHFLMDPYAYVNTAIQLMLV